MRFWSVGSDVRLPAWLRTFRNRLSDLLRMKRSVLKGPDSRGKECFKKAWKSDADVQWWRNAGLGLPHALDVISLALSVAFVIASTNLSRVLILDWNTTNHVTCRVPACACSFLGTFPATVFLSSMIKDQENLGLLLLSRHRRWAPPSFYFRSYFRNGRALRRLQGFSGAEGVCASGLNGPHDSWSRQSVTSSRRLVWSQSSFFDIFSFF